MKSVSNELVTKSVDTSNYEVGSFRAIDFTAI